MHYKKPEVARHKLQLITLTGIIVVYLTEAYYLTDKSVEDHGGHKYNGHNLYYLKVHTQEVGCTF